MRGELCRLSNCLQQSGNEIGHQYSTGQSGFNRHPFISCLHASCHTHAFLEGQDYGEYPVPDVCISPGNICVNRDFDSSCHQHRSLQNHCQATRQTYHCACQDIDCGGMVFISSIDVAAVDWLGQIQILPQANAMRLRDS